MSLEVDEIRKTYWIYHTEELDNDAFIEALNAEPAGLIDHDGTIRIINWGVWADFFQRHLCNAMVSGYDFVRNQWGVRV
jgi:hypothetical protein